MRIETYRPDQIPDEIAEAGRTYILQRFMDEWHIDRKDEISKESIINRTNLVAFDNSSIIGWLGVNADGELVNGCAGPNGQAGAVLLRLIKQAISQESPKQYYAYTPIDYLSSAYICISAGLQLSKDIQEQVTRKAYKNRIVTLAKLVLETPVTASGPTKTERRERREELHQLIDSIIDQGLLSRIDAKRKRIFARLKRHGRLVRPMTWTSQAALTLGGSIFYYLIIVHFWGGGFAKYHEFLSNQKPTVDTEELSEYLQISTEALKNGHDLICENVATVNRFIDREPEDGNAKAAQSSKRQKLDIVNQNADAKLYLEKLETSFEYMRWILERFKEDVNGNRLDAAKKAANRYEALLVYLSSSRLDEFNARIRKLSYESTASPLEGVMNILSLASPKAVTPGGTKRQGGEEFQPEMEDRRMRDQLAKQLGAKSRNAIEVSDDEQKCNGLPPTEKKVIPKARVKA
jgi:hypothetical protein